MEVPGRSGVPPPRAHGDVRAVILLQRVQSSPERAPKSCPWGREDNREGFFLRLVP